HANFRVKQHRVPLAAIECEQQRWRDRCLKSNWGLKYDWRDDKYGSRSNLPNLLRVFPIGLVRIWVDWFWPRFGHLTGKLLLKTSCIFCRHRWASKTISIVLRPKFRVRRPRRVNPPPPDLISPANIRESPQKK